VVAPAEVGRLMSRLVAVAVAVPFLPALTYSVPDNESVPPVGARVIVPLGQRLVTGCVVPLSSKEGDGENCVRDHVSSVTAPDRLREISKTLDTEAYLPTEVLDLALWVAEYYACGPGEAIATAMPPLAMSSRQTTGRTMFKSVRVARLTDAGRDSYIEPNPSGLGPRQRLALRRLGSAEGEVELTVLASEGVGADSVNRLERRGLVTIRSREIERDPFAKNGGLGSVQMAGASVRTLTAEQQIALGELKTLAAEEAFRVALLHGVTGSGKTEVYLRLAREVCGGGRSVLMLVPEIALTSAVTSIFRAAFGGRVAIQHSGLSDGQRHDQWHRIRRGEVDVVVGTRSGVFAPVADLGLVIVDEEHDGSYKQEENPRYHARSVATVRAQRAGALVVLGSATPSLESYYHVRRGRYRCVAMKKRVQERPLPEVDIVDMRAELAAEGPDVVLSRTLREGLCATVERGEQALILLNRRGYATGVLCRQCGLTLECPNCSVALTLHRSDGRAQCHYCNYSKARPSTCVNCAGPYLEAVGFGTERVEHEVSKLLPDAIVARFDRDVVRRRGVGLLLLSQFRKGEIHVLVGTQMIAKGHDFPKVTLVGVVSADMGLTAADFRAGERTFQLLTQVAGRAGRGERPGRAIIQSYYPEHYSIGYACQQDYEPFFDEELRFRSDLGYPPTLSIVNAVVRGRSYDSAMEDGHELARLLRSDAASFEVFGPAVAPLSKVRGQHRVQVFLKGLNRRAMREALKAALATRSTLRRKVAIDVDPVNMV